MVEDNKAEHPLKDLFGAQQMTHVLFAKKAGIGLQAISMIRSGEFDQNLHDKEIRKGWSERKRLGVVQVLARVLMACGKNSQEWVKETGLTLTTQEEQVMVVASSQRPKPLSVPELRLEEWNTFLSIKDHILTKDDLEKLMKAQEALGNFFTIKLAIEFLLSIKDPNG